MPPDPTSFEHLAKLRWPGAICSECPKPPNLMLDYARGRVRCSNCKHDFRLTAGTLAHRMRLNSQEWIRSAELFSAAREGISVRVFAEQLQKYSATHDPDGSMLDSVRKSGSKIRSKNLSQDSKLAPSISPLKFNPESQVGLDHAHSILKVFRSALKRLPFRITGKSRLIFEIETGLGHFKVHPPRAMGSGRANWRMIMVCNVEMRADFLQNLHFAYVKRLNDNHDETLATAVREATDGATSVYVFEGSRCTGEKRLNYEAFVREKYRAGADLLKLTNRLRHLLHTVPQGRVHGAEADGHLAEFNFRQEYRMSHTNRIADLLLELVLKPLDQNNGAPGKTA